MIIKTLIENTAINHKVPSEHGLSLYIETARHRYLFDVGETALFLSNAQRMDVAMASIDTVVISHGHADHGGGLPALLKENNQAVIYIRPEAFAPHYSLHHDGMKNISIDPSIQYHRQIKLTSINETINEEAMLFSGVSERLFFPTMNDHLFQGDVKRHLDKFDHEQNMIIKEGNNVVLLIGCAHRGVANIINHTINKLHLTPTHVIGGFHLSSRAHEMGESLATIKALAHFLKGTQAIYYTGHCTGPQAYRHMKKIMGQQLQKFMTGKTLFID